ncbi:transposable element Tcb1 transposase [Trichonephila clavipes]|uniref:Transposable element Tcb1 transposase n=1 Tax=Trichonephila clavipes TaxID=2585209 RepID=A0A8X6W4P9_TRICX|nr:transposable element Tcb1 transposase [Trichonephila clavipes]
MIPTYNKRRAAFPYETGIHYRRKADFLPEEDTTMSYSRFEPEPTRLQAEGHSHHTGWVTEFKVMRVGTTNRHGQSHPPQCTTSREDRQVVRMTVMDRSVTSRTVAEPIESVTHHSVTARTIRRRLQQSGLSARRPLLGLTLTQNHRRLRHQWCDERRMWTGEWNEVVFTDESRICLQHHDGRIRVWIHRGERMLNSCFMHLHTGPTLGIMEPAVLPYLQGLATAIFQQNNARPHVECIVQKFFVHHQIELLPWLARSQDVSLIETSGLLNG